MARRRKGERTAQAPIDAHRRLLARLHLARSDIRMTQQMCDAASVAELTERDPLSWAFHHAVVICYARPFTSNDSVGALAAKWRRFEDDHLQANHDAVMRQRDEVVAHSDLSWRPIFLSGRGVKLPSGIVTTRPGLYNVQPVLAPVSYEAVSMLCADLFPRLNAAFDECFLKLYPGGYDGPPRPLMPVDQDGPVNVTFD